MAKKDIGKIVRLLRKDIGSSTAAVWATDPFRVLISTVLSQRTRDENTIVATKRLFSRFKNPKQLSNAKLTEIQRLIKPSGFYRVKAKRVREISRVIVSDFNGKTPDSMEELLLLPGVGRKTAGCVLVYAFRKPAIPVDTHVHRISNRIGLVKTKTPLLTEEALMETIPRRYWIELNELMVKFGQRTCIPRNPRCWKCPLTSHCDYYRKVYRKSAAA